MTTSTRCLIWLAVLLVGVLPLIPDPDEPLTATAWDQLAAWDDPDDDDALSPHDHLTGPDTNPFLLPPCGIPGDAPGLRGLALPAKGLRAAQFPGVPCQIPRAPPID